MLRHQCTTQNCRFLHRWWLSELGWLWSISVIVPTYHCWYTRETMGLFTSLASQKVLSAFVVEDVSSISTVHHGPDLVDGSRIVPSIVHQRWTKQITSLLFDVRIANYLTFTTEVIECCVSRYVHDIVFPHACPSALRCHLVYMSKDVCFWLFCLRLSWSEMGDALSLIKASQLLCYRTNECVRSYEDRTKASQAIFRELNPHASRTWYHRAESYASTNYIWH